MFISLCNNDRAHSVIISWMYILYACLNVLKKLPLFEEKEVWVLFSLSKTNKRGNDSGIQNNE